MSYIKQQLRRVVVVVAVLTLLAARAFGAEATPKAPEFVPGSWTLVLLPDTQIYSEQFPGLFTLQTHWIVKNKDKYNICYVLHLGDLTHKSTVTEWRHAQEAMSELDGKVPYAIVPGNHDYSSLATRETCLNEYFPLSKFKGWPSFGGAMNDDMCNTYHLFSAGGTDWIVVALEWGPRNETVQWANEVLAKHPQRKAILLTHAYLNDASIRYDFAKRKDSPERNPHVYPANAPVNDGEELWQKLVRKNNFIFTFNGHVLNSGVGFLSSKNDCGKMTHQMLVNYQMRQLGGEGYLRTLEFLPNGKTVHVKSHSPLYDKNLENAEHQFSIELNP